MDEMAGHAAENPFAQPAMAVGSGDHDIDLVLGGEQVEVTAGIAGGQLGGCGSLDAAVSLQPGGDVGDTPDGIAFFVVVVEDLDDLDVFGPVSTAAARPR